MCLFTCLILATWNHLGWKRSLKSQSLTTDLTPISPVTISVFFKGFYREDQKWTLITYYLLPFAGGRVTELIPVWVEKHLYLSENTSSDSKPLKDFQNSSFG